MKKKPKKDSFSYNTDWKATDLVPSTDILGTAMIMTAVATPGASANSAMVFGNSDWVSSKHALQLGWMFTATALTVYILVAYPLCMLIAA